MTEAFNVLTEPRPARGVRREAPAQASSGETRAAARGQGLLPGGQAKLNEGHAEEAVRLFKAAVHLDPAQGAVSRRLAQALEADGAFGEAARPGTRPSSGSPTTPSTIATGRRMPGEGRA